VIFSLTVSPAVESDELTSPVSASDHVRSGTELPSPLSSTPDIADSGRISFGAAMRPSFRR
jgi:hypothetical protein